MSLLRPFEIHEPATVPEASRLLGEYGERATIYAGGTELLLVMKEGLAHYLHLVDIKTIPGLNAIEYADGILRIGALATHRQIERSPVVREHAPLMAEVAAQVANLRVRTVGTLGGNLCFAEPHSDPGALLMAWDALLVLTRDGTERQVRAEAFFTGILQTARAADEVLVRVEMRPLAAGTGGAYHKFVLHERPTAGAAAVVSLHEDHIASARIVVGSVGPVPMRVPEAEAVVAGRPAAPDTFRAAAAIAGRQAEILEDLYGSVEYKRHLVTLLAERALADAAARAHRPPRGGGACPPGRWH